MAPSVRGTVESVSLVQELMRLSLGPRLLFVTAGAQQPTTLAASGAGASQGGVWGLARVVRTEQLRCAW